MTNTFFKYDSYLLRLYFYENISVKPSFYSKPCNKTSPFCSFFCHIIRKTGRNIVRGKCISGCAFVIRFLEGHCALRHIMVMLNCFSIRNLE